jgi:YD repeat-containing protein
MVVTSASISGVAGNLLYDGTTSTYDALNRLLTTTTGGQTRTNTYNGENVLVAQAANSITTSYTQDLVSPLSQVLQTKVGSATTNYLYGLERLASVSGSTRTWYGTDALGSVRLTMTNAGLPLDAFSYDPWGTPEGAAPPTFGFTGEMQDASGLLNLRARWYQPTSWKGRT